MPSYIRYQQTNRLRDKSTLFFLCSFILVVVYTSVIGFVIVHVLKVTKSVEDDNEELLRTNQKLEENLEQLIFRIENLEEKISKNKSAMTYVNIITRPGTAETGTKSRNAEMKKSTLPPKINVKGKELFRRTNQKLGEKLEQLIFRIENLEEIISNNKSAINIISRPGTAETGTKENMQERRNEEKHNK